MKVILYLLIQQMSQNGINNTESRVRSVTLTHLLLKLANTNVIPTAELTGMEYITYATRDIVQATTNVTLDYSNCKHSIYLMQATT